MAFKDEYDFYQIKNEAEDLVLNELEIQLGNIGNKICLCNECVVDMAAIALNLVKPLYRYSLLGSLYATQAANDNEFANSVQRAVAQAIEKVSGNPSHD